MYYTAECCHRLAVNRTKRTVSRAEPINDPSTHSMKTKSFNISIPPELVRRIDRAAKEEYRSRSELIREAVRLYLLNREEWETLLALRYRENQRLHPSAKVPRPTNPNSAYKAMRRQGRIRDSQIGE